MRRRLGLLALCWCGIFLIVMGFDILTPQTVWGALVRLPVNFASAPAATWIGLYFLQGPRAARRWWLYFRFVAANWNHVDLILARGERQQDRTVTVGQGAFNGLLRRMQERQK
jgi:hypothetical protein